MIKKATKRLKKTRFFAPTPAFWVKMQKAMGVVVLCCGAVIATPSNYPESFLTIAQYGMTCNLFGIVLAQFTANAPKENKPEDNQ